MRITFSISWRQCPPPPRMEEEAVRYGSTVQLAFSMWESALLKRRFEMLKKAAYILEHPQVHRLGSSLPF